MDDSQLTVAPTLEDESRTVGGDSCLINPLTLEE
jgi:hypothetical protein